LRIHYNAYRSKKEAGAFLAVRLCRLPAMNFLTMRKHQGHTDSRVKSRNWQLCCLIGWVEAQSL